jgi:thiol-disulfide isomerase/thioredoxin
MNNDESTSCMKMPVTKSVEKNKCFWILFVFLFGIYGGLNASLLEKIEPLEGLTIDAYSFQNESSRTIEGSTLKGRPTLIHFWATFCAPCLDELKVMKDSVLGRDDFAFYSICINKKETEEIEAFYKKHGLEGFPIYKDMDRTLLNVFQNQGVPATYFVSSDGVVLGRTYGVIDWKNPENKAFLADFVAGTLVIKSERRFLQKMTNWVKNIIK